MNKIKKDQNQIPEEPIIIIEREQVGPVKTDNVAEDKPRRNWLRYLLLILLALLVIGVAYAVYLFYQTRASSTPFSLDSADLATPGVMLFPDSVDSVSVDMYAIQGLHASIEMEEPRPDDKDVYFYCQTIDSPINGKYLNTVVLNGEVLGSGKLKQDGYFAIKDDSIKMGVTSNEDLKLFFKEYGGSFFSQYVLIDNGRSPKTFPMEGNKQWRAMGLRDERLFYLMAKNEVPMPLFVNAIRELGFTDAIYLAGSDTYSYYRTSDGRRHDISPINDNGNRNSVNIPWLVFRASDDY